MKYIVLLRGINVGGKNKLSMPELGSAFEAHGFTEVSTYINSGNVLFSSGETDILALKEKCQSLIQSSFQMDIPVAVISAQALTDALAHAPSWWNASKDSKHNAIFVIPPATPEAVCVQVGKIKPEYEQVDCYGPVIFWSAPLRTFSRTRWSKVAGSTAYGSITIRNANTALKLAELAGI